MSDDENPPFDWSAWAWGRIVASLEAGRRPTVEDMLSAMAGADAGPVGWYAADLAAKRVKAKAGRRPRQDWDWDGLRFAIEAGRNPSARELLLAVASDDRAPEAVRKYARSLATGKARPSDGPRPRWGLNNSALQRTKDILLVERVHKLKAELEKDGLPASLRDVFIEIEDRSSTPKNWTAFKIWRAVDPAAGKRPWNGETAQRLYRAAKNRLKPKG
jgi:hypothetical protein